MTRKSNNLSGALLLIEVLSINISLMMSFLCVRTVRTSPLACKSSRQKEISAFHFCLTQFQIMFVCKLLAIWPHFGDYVLFFLLLYEMF